MFALVAPTGYAMKSLSEDAMSDVVGQALYRIEDTQGVAQPDGTSMDFTKLTLGLRIEQNVNIEEIALGKYYRPNAGYDADPTDAYQQTDLIYHPAVSGVANIEYTTGKHYTYDPTNRWNCSVIRCGGLEKNDTNQQEHTTFAVSSLMYATQFEGLDGIGNFKEFTTFQSGFDPENKRSQYDVILRDVTMGYVNDETGELVDMVAEKPYIEMAYYTDPDTSVRSLQGFRFGFEKQNGVMGNAIDIFSGVIIPNAKISADIQLLGLSIGAAKLNIEVDISGVRTPGYVNPVLSKVNDCSGLACSFLGELITGGDIRTPAGLAIASPEAQAFPLQSINLVDATDFFFSVQKKAIQFPDNPSGAKPKVALPGFWINMGGDQGLQVDNQAPHHPDNYFPGHPNHEKYGIQPGFGGLNNNQRNGYY